MGKLIQWPYSRRCLPCGPHLPSEKFLIKGMQTAIESAVFSDFPTFKLGAALYSRRKLISVGWNHTKTHPLLFQGSKHRRQESRHAEFSVLLGVPKHLVVGSTVFVARVTKGGRVSMAKPCPSCQNLLKTAGVRKVYYSNPEGIMEEYRV